MRHLESDGGIQTEEDTQSMGKAHSAVYTRQIQLLYQNQYLAIISTTAFVAILFLFISATTGWSVLLPWGVAFAVTFCLRGFATRYYLQRMAGFDVSFRSAEQIYFAGILMTALVWALMFYYLFPALGSSERYFLFVCILGLVAASHITMGYRKTAYHTYILVIMTSVTYSIYISDLPGGYLFVTVSIFFTVYMIGASLSFYNSVYQLISAEEESIRQKHKLLIQREQANLESKSKSDFLSRMSHELRTPLNAVLGMNELQLRDTGNPLVGIQLERANKIREASTHLLSLVNDVLDLSRIESDSLRVETSAVDCMQLLSESMKLLEVRARESEVEVNLAETDEDVWVSADHGRLKQVFVNLIDNAIKYNFPGGVVEVSIESAGEDRWRVSVKDTGRGIAESEFEELFKPFSRLETGMDSIDGVGVGLSFSKNLVELMGGEIGVDSAPGEGSEFWVELRASEPVRHDEIIAENPVGLQEHAADSVESETLREGKLLLVEDNEVNQEVAYDMLLEMGFEVDVVSDGQQALDQMKRSSYAAVLMDCQMPVMDGISATREIRNLEAQYKSPHVPIIALTAHALQGAREQCLASGMDDFLSKPFDFNDLESILRKWVVVPDATSSVPLHSIDTVEQASQAVVIDIVALSRLRTRKSSLVDKVVRRYLDESPSALDKIGSLAMANDIDDLSLHVHTFKSSSLTVGATDVAEHCRNIEAMCSAGNVDAAAVQRLMTAYEMASRELDRIIASGRFSVREQSDGRRS